MNEYILLENKMVSTKSGERIVVKLGQEGEKYGYKVIKNELTFWLDPKSNNDFQKNMILSLPQIAEGSKVIPKFDITQKGFDFKVYLNGIEAV